MEYASFWRRFGAFWLDCLVLLPLFAIHFFLSEKFRLYSLYSFVPNLLFYIWFEVYLVKRFGGTPGKLFLNIRITMADGSPITTNAALLRYSVSFITSAIAVLGAIMATMSMTDEFYHSLKFSERAHQITLLKPVWCKIVGTLSEIWTWSEFFVILLNEKRRSIHDFMAGTVVIHSPPPHQSL